MDVYQHSVKNNEVKYMIHNSFSCSGIYFMNDAMPCVRGENAMTDHQLVIEFN